MNGWRIKRRIQDDNRETQTASSERRQLLCPWVFRRADGSSKYTSSDRVSMSSWSAARYIAMVSLKVKRSYFLELAM